MLDGLSINEGGEDDGGTNEKNKSTQSKIFPTLFSWFFQVYFLVLKFKMIKPNIKKV